MGAVVSKLFLDIVAWYHRLNKHNKKSGNRALSLSKYFKGSSLIKKGGSRSAGSKSLALKQDVVIISKILPRIIPFKTKDAYIQLTERTAKNSAISIDVLSQLNRYTDISGNILPYLFVEGLSVYDKGKGVGKSIMKEIIKIAEEKYGGRLILKPENKVSNPNPFYAKCGLVSTSKKGAKEIIDFFEKGKPFASGNSDPMYLPIR